VPGAGCRVPGAGCVGFAAVQVSALDNIGFEIQKSARPHLKRQWVRFEIQPFAAWSHLKCEQDQQAILSLVTAFGVSMGQR